jgi:demethylmenaquinone methyltransferase/2-methoxy-6-polyprenyl-1,4-benzoquinol methylase
MENKDLSINTELSRVDSYKMFDRIAGRYDLLNRIFSLGLHSRWRRKVADYLPKGDNLKLLDLATGTGDLLLKLVSKSSKISSTVGLDMSANMLEIAKHKILARNLSEGVNLVRADAVEVPFGDNSFDVATIAFGIRNVTDVSTALKQMHRVLKPGGRAIVLEFSLPKNFLLRKLYLFYLRNIIPFFGSLISADSYAYRYLGRTIETFPFGRDFCVLMENAGFKNVKAVPLTFGAVSIYYGDKIEH